MIHAIKIIIKSMIIKNMDLLNFFEAFGTFREDRQS